MTVHQLPSRSQDHANALSGVVDEVSEDDCQALESVALDVKELVGVRLDHLQKESHPLVEGLIQAVVDQFVFDSVSPTDRSQIEVEDVQNLFSAVASNLFVCEG